MATVQRFDRYGRPAGYINPINNQVDPYLSFKSADKTTTYQCFFETGSAARAIWRIKKVGSLIQICITWGVWTTDEATLESYTWYPVNDYFELTDGVLTHPTVPAPDIDPETAAETTPETEG